MTDIPERRGIRPLGKHHDRAAFSCGVQELDRYLRERAGQEQRKNVARVFVVEGPNPSIVAGFYTLSSYAIDVGHLPDGVRKSLPRYPLIPAALIGRLAIDLKFQGRGLGQFLLIDALSRVIDASGDLAIYSVVVDAKDDAAVSFYRRYGFIPFPSSASRLFLPIATARAAIVENLHG